MVQLKRLVTSGACAAALVPFAFAQDDAEPVGKVDKRIPAYTKGAGVSGSIKSVGSDTMNNLMTLWAEAFRATYPNVEIEIEGKGSGTAPPALIEGTATFGPMSRAMKAKESDAFEKEFGYKATQLPTAIDMLAVYVHKDNPIAKAGLTLQQIDGIFSKNRRGGYPKNIETWGDVGLTGAWANKPISMFGRNSASGTYGYFKKNALFDGDYKDEVKEQPGSSSVIQGVANDKFAIGYSGIGYKTADVAAIPVGRAGAENVEPVAAKAADYPLSRFLWLSVNYKPGSQLDPLRREFIRFVFSRGGQLVVDKDGYLPLTFELCHRSLAQIGVELKPATVEAGFKR